MKLIFSEHKSDYSRYIFPYVIWAIPEKNDPPASIFNKGFLPSALDLSRFYLCRQIRVQLQDFVPSSENRRIFRKCSEIEFNLLPRADFDFNPWWQEFCLKYADSRLGKNIMSQKRLQALLESPLISHVLVFRDAKTGDDVGLVTLYIEPDELVYYYYAFYDLDYYKQGLGIFMMTAAVAHFAESAKKFIYLGTCYSRNALYKTQFSGAEFFNGFKWSDNLRELKCLIERDSGPVSTHLLESQDFQQSFYPDGLDDMLWPNTFTLRPD